MRKLPLLSAVSYLCLCSLLPLQYVPTCAKPSATSNATFQCTPPLVYASSSGSSTSPSDATCCAGTCGDTRPDVNGTQPIDCGPGFVRVNGSDTFTPANQSRCCVVSGRCRMHSNVSAACAIQLMLFVDGHAAFEESFTGSCVIADRF
jgi:hypothetical protein